VRSFQCHDRNDKELPSILLVVLLSAIPVGAAFLGATTAALRPPGRVVRSSIQHFAAGVFFSVVAFELLPKVRRGHDPFEVGRTVLADAPVHTLAGIHSFGCAALLFLVTEELLIEAHESADTVVTMTMCFQGFLIFLLLGMIG
jgi:hypothetical protein